MQVMFQFILDRVVADDTYWLRIIAGFITYQPYQLIHARKFSPQMP